MRIKLSVILLAATISCGCRQAKTHLESHPAATLQPAQVAAIPTPMQVPATPTPLADSTPFLISSSIKWKTVEEFDYQWKADRPATHFKLEIPEGYDDPGDFIRIHIQPKGRAEFVLNNDDGWVEYSDPKYPDVYGKLKEHNLVQSKYVLILPYSKKPDEGPLVFLRSWGYASSPERVHIIGWQPSGDPFLLFNQEFFLVDFTDVDGDGVNEIVGKPCLGEGVGSIGSHAGTYSPYQVYKIETPIVKTAVLSASLTEQYTRQMYDGYAGPECSDEYVTIHPKNKSIKPRVVAKEQFEKMEKASTSTK